MGVPKSPWHSYGTPRIPPADPLHRVTHHGALLADRVVHHRDRWGTMDDGISSSDARTGGPEPLINGESNENIREYLEDGWWFMVMW